MVFALIPIMCCAMIRNLKFIAPLSTAANISMAIGLGIILSYCLVDLPPLATRTAVAHWSQIPLFFGTAIYAFEGISLVRTDLNKLAEIIYKQIKIFGNSYDNSVKKK